MNNRFAPGCRCCGPAPCSSGSWPSTLYLTADGTTHTLAYNSLLGLWTRATRYVLTIASQDPNAGCAAATTAEVNFTVRCVGSALEVMVRIGLATATCGCNWTKVFFLTSTGIGFVGTVTTFSNSPVAGTGTFSSTPDPACPSLTPPLAGASWTLSQ